MKIDPMYGQQFEACAKRLVTSYHGVASINHLESPPLPNPRILIPLTERLKELIFPGYQRRLRAPCRHPAARIRRALSRLFEPMAEQFAVALRHDRQQHANNGHHNDVDRQGQQQAMRLLQALPRLRRRLARDVEAAFDSDPAARSLDEIVVSYPGLEAITIYRIAHEMHRCGIPLIPRMLSEWAHSRTGIDIHPAARIGPSFFIDHGTGVVVGETCHVASHVKLYQGVTLGALNFCKDTDGKLIRTTKRHPTLERNVVVYANATILGGKTVIGANSVIGAGVTVNKSVPPDTVVTLEAPSLKFRQGGRARRVTNKQSKTGRDREPQRQPKSEQGSGEGVGYLRASTQVFPSLTESRV